MESGSVKTLIVSTRWHSLDESVFDLNCRNRCDPPPEAVDLLASPPIPFGTIDQKERQCALIAQWIVGDGQHHSRTPYRG